MKSREVTHLPQAPSAVAAEPRPPLRRSDVRALLQADQARMLAHFGSRQAHGYATAMRAIRLYRWCHYFNQRGWRTLARLFWHLNLVTTGADLTPITEIGPGLVIDQPLGLTVFGRAGSNLTLAGHNVIGGSPSRRDAGAGVGRPWIGDDVTLGFGAMVLGPVRIEDRAELMPGAVVMTDVPQEGVVPQPTCHQRLGGRGMALVEVQHAA